MDRFEAGSPEPFPGLRSFQKAESDIFFGRDDHVDEMIAKLAINHFLCVTGPSGCGKSSLARTGLMNSLEAGFLKGRGSDWIFCDFRPGDRPLQALQRSLANAIVGDVSTSDAADNEPALRNEIFDTLDNHLRRQRKSNDLNEALETIALVRGRPILILVDQFEELFRYAQTDPVAAVTFVEVLLQTARARSSIYIVITIRADELEKCSRYPGLTKAINQSQFLTPTLDRYQIQKAIEGPIALFGGRIATKLSMWMLNSLEDELDKLPLMQHALKLLYVRKTRAEEKPDVILTVEDFLSVFGLDPQLDLSSNEGRLALRNSLSNQLDSIYESMPDSLKVGVGRAFCALTGMESSSRDIRRPIKLSELAKTIDLSLEDTRAIIRRFISSEGSYLVVTGDGTLAENDIVDVMHECVLRLWSRLQTEWLVAERESADNILLLARQAKALEESGKSPLRLFLSSDVLRGRMLQRFARWFDQARPNATWAARYLSRFSWPEPEKGRGENHSVAEIYEKILSLLKLSNRRKYASQAAIVLGGLVFLGLAVLTIYDRVSEAEDRANRTIKSLRQSQALVDLVLQVLQPPTHSDSRIKNLQQLTSLFGEARDTGESLLIDSAHKSTWIGLLSVHELSRFHHGDGVENQLFAADFSADGSRILTVNEAGVLRQWSLGTVRQSDFERALGPPDASGKAEAGRSLRVSPTGDLAAVGFRRGSVILVDLKSRAEKTALLSANGLSPHEGPVMDLVFSSDGSLLVTSSLAGELVIWQRPDGTAKSMNSSTVDPLGWTPVRIVDWKKEHESNGIWQKEDEADSSDTAMQIWSVDVSLDKRMVAFGLGNGRVCLQSLDPSATLSLVCSKEGHLSGKAVKAVKFQPNAPILASAGNDDRITIWNFTPDSLRATPLKIFQDNDIWDLDFSTDGTLIASAGWDGSIRVFESSTGRPIVTMDGHTSAIRSVRFDRSSRKLVTASLDHTARVWTPFSSRIGLLGLSYLFPFDNPQSRPQVYSVALGAGGGWVTFETGHSVFLKEADKPPVELPSRISVDLVSNRDTWPQSKLNFHQVLAHPTENTVFASALEPVALAWSKSSEEWSRSPAIIPLPGEKIPGGMRPLAISPSGMLLAIAIWEGGKSSVLLCPRTGNGQIWTCSEASAKRIPLTSIEPSRRPLECRGPSMSLPQALDFSANGRLLGVAQDDCTVSIYDVDTRERVKGPYIGHIGRITSVDFSPDDSTVVSASSDWTARVWRLADGSSYMIKHNAAVNAVVFSPSGKWVATVSSDETLKVSYASTGQELLALPIEQDSILSADLKNTPLGAIMATGSAGGTINTIHFFEKAEETYKHATAFLKENIGLAPSQNAP